MIIFTTLTSFEKLSTCALNQAKKKIKDQITKIQKVVLFDDQVISRLGPHDLIDLYEATVSFEAMICIDQTWVKRDFKITSRAQNTIAILPFRNLRIFNVSTHCFLTWFFILFTCGPLLFVHHCQVCTTENSFCPFGFYHNMENYSTSLFSPVFHVYSRLLSVSDLSDLL